MAVEFKDYYKTLGLSRTAGEDEIRKAFRKLARKYHPDVAKDKGAEDKFKEINEAYEVLGDPEKRKKYDTLGASWNQGGGFRPPPEWEESQRFRRARPGEPFEFHFGGTGFSDFFEQFFGGRGARPSGFPGGEFGEVDRQPRAHRGNDIESDILVSLHEALQGSIRTVSFRRVDARTGKTETHSFRVRIPPGVQEGQMIRVAGKGEEGIAGGSPGDLYLRVRFAKHPDFRIHGNDLFYDLEVAPWEAVLGASVSVPTLEAPVTMRIPAGVVNGQRLRLRGKGLPTGQGARGDLFVVISIAVPTTITAEEKSLWEQLAKLSAFSPRKQP